MRITISGPPGSGKTTVCKLLAQRLGFEYIISGNVFRDMAQKLGMTLAEFGRLAEEDPKYDKMIDDSMVTSAAERENIILEARLAGHNLARQDIRAFKVCLDADPWVRAQRLMEREIGDNDLVMTEMLEREESEAVRYRQYYGIDLRDKSVYDLIIDTTDITPEEVVDIIVKGLGGYQRRTW